MNYKETLMKLTWTPKRHSKHRKKISTRSGGEECYTRERAAARCARQIGRKILRMQARKAKAKHDVKCSFLPGKRMPKRNFFTELYTNDIFTENRSVWEKGPQRHHVHHVNHVTTGLDGHATFENAESKFQFTCCIQLR